MFDLNYLPLHLSNGMEIAELPGLWVAAAPRRAQRSRSKDMLIMLLTLTGSEAQPPDNLNQILERLAYVYFQAPGSVTSGMHAAVDQLNALLIKRNLKTSNEDQRVTGIFSLVVLRRDQLYIAHAGPTYTYLLAQKGLTTFHDAQNAGRGLGLARSVKLAYFREAVQPNDLLLLSAASPQDWQTSGLAGGLSIPLDQLRRRLLSQASGQLEAALIQFTPGKGEALLQKPRIPFISAGLGEKLAAQEAPSPAQPVEASQPAPQPQAAAAPPEPAPARPAAPPRTLPRPAAAEPASARQPARRTPQMDVAQQNEGRQRRNATRKELRRLLNGWRGAWQRLSAAVNRTLLRTLPGSEETTSALPVRSLVLIAVLVPIMVTALATTIYFRSGRANQRDAYLQQAQRFISDAIVQSDPALKISNWQQVLYWVEKSEEFGRTETSIDLRRQAEKALDELQGIIRLDMQPTLLSGLPEGANITRIVPTTTELYLFDSNEGRVYRMFMTGEGYKLDPNFDCATNPLIGKLVDFAPLTRLEGILSSPTVIAVNETGHYMYCGLTDKPVEQAFLPPSTGDWGRVSRIASSDYGMLYVLDASNNAVYIIDPFYRNIEEENQTQAETESKKKEEVAPSHSNNEPRMFFNLQVPRLDDVKDIAFNNGDLYLLHADNTTTICTLRTSYDDQTRCIDPAPYADTRSGRETANLTFPGASFSRMFTSQPPVPSLYILDTVGPTINQLSLQLNLQRQLSPRSATESPLPSTPPTALAVTSNRLVIVAFGNQLYHGQLP